ncbi:unnamed protein product [Clonostachys rosea]|uniref:CASTOR ACT domain-containing protein n=1 Tax=Bionectria ochroleuca TaxID=29856 RepID=A0ABY6TXK2_BIOOC|nr:unnamed protein product [Clonostachys rosea]
MNAQISFLEGEYSLIHIPLALYSSFVQPILQVLLLPQSKHIPGGSENGAGHELEGLTSDGQHNFLNISVTPIEVSIVCHSSWAKNVFEPIIRNLPPKLAGTVDIPQTTYVILAVISAGLDAASRVMDLTSPLALAGISIFYISTYYSDFILVPVKERENVVKALLSKGFELSHNQTSYVNSSTYSRSRTSSGSGSPPRTPPPASITELQARAFDLLSKRKVAPTVVDGLELVQCSGREISPITDEVYDHRPSRSRHSGGRTWVDTIDAKLYTCIVAALAAKPRFLSITLTHDDPPSLLLDKSLLDMFGESLIGDKEGTQIAIFLDLLNLSSEVTGIICGVAGKLVQDMQMTASSELSYLSTARAGAVILPEEHSPRALDILRPLLAKD